MRVMDTVGVASFKELFGKYVRAAVNFSDDGGRVDIIGNIIDDKWFDIKDFFTEVPTPVVEPDPAEPSVDETSAEETAENETSN